MSTRRKFIVDCSTAVAALALVPISTFKVAAAPFEPVEPMTHAVFAKQVGTIFQAQPGAGQPVNITLLKVRQMPLTTTPAGRRPAPDFGHEKFSLIFSGPNDTVLASGIHPFAHPRLGRFDMHLGQIGLPTADGIRYEAVFNRPTLIQLTKN